MAVNVVFIGGPKDRKYETFENGPPPKVVQVAARAIGERQLHKGGLSEQCYTTHQYRLEQLRCDGFTFLAYVYEDAHINVIEWLLRAYAEPSCNFIYREDPYNGTV